MSRLLLLFLAVGLIILGLQPLRKEYGGLNGFFETQASNLSGLFENWSLEEWAEKRDRIVRAKGRTDRPRIIRKESNSEPKGGFFDFFNFDSSDSRAPDINLPDMSLPEVKVPGFLKRNEKKSNSSSAESREHSHEEATDKLNYSDREELNELINDL